MAYMVVDRAGQHCVYKRGDNDEPSGESLGCHPTAEAAGQHIAALESDQTPQASWQFQMDALLAAFDEHNPFGIGVAVLDPSGLELSVMIAETIEQKARGMVGQDWGDYDGMVFVEPVETTATFHMVGVDHPIVLALFDNDGSFLERFALSPGDPGVAVRSAFRYALELPWEQRGMLDLNGSTLRLKLD